MAHTYLAEIGAGDLSSPIVFFNANDDKSGSIVSGISDDLRREIADWAGAAVVAHHHRSSDAWIFIAIHDVTLGPAAGGTRIKYYQKPIDGLRDAFHLSQAMTSKWAIINSERGGGKAVLALTRDLNAAERCRILRDYAVILNALKGAFFTAGDLGTTPDDLVYLARFTSYVTGGEQSLGESTDSGTYTALGLRAAIRACLRHRLGDEKIAGRTVLVQGLGQVGGMLARLLVLDGARVLINDIDAKRVAEFEKELVCTFVPPDCVYETPCDVYAPCGVGGTLNDHTVRHLSCQIICGGANNQLASRMIAEELHKRNILYAPDYVVNAGGAIGLTMFRSGSTDHEIYARIEGIESTLMNIFQRASQQSLSPERAADSLVQTVLAAARRPGYQFNPETVPFVQTQSPQ